MNWLDRLIRRRRDGTGRLVVYSAIFGGIPDQLRPPAGFRSDPGVAFVCFTDRVQEAAKLGPWLLRPALWSDVDPRRTARYHKILSHVAFADVDYSLWLDGNIRLMVDPWTLVRRHLADGLDIAVFKHRHRRCVYEELEACVRLDKDEVDVMRAQVERYRALGYPADNGLAETGVLARRHSPQVRALNEAWWREIVAGSLRDQLSFPYVMWSKGLRYGHLKGKPDRSPYVRYTRHR